MDGSYVEQTAHDLVFYILNGKPKTNLESLAKGCAQKNNMNAEGNIIGASDYIIFTLGTFIFSEVCACIPLDTGEEILNLTKFKSSDQGSIKRFFELERDNLKFEYNFAWQILEWKKGLAAWSETKNQYNSFRGKIDQGEEGYIAIIKEFPCGEVEIIPETIVTVEISENTVDVNTMHTYPEFHIVKTTSKISI